MIVDLEMIDPIHHEYTSIQLDTPYIIEVYHSMFAITILSLISYIFLY